MLFVPEDIFTVSSWLRNECGDNLPLWKPATPAGLERIRFAVLKLSNGSLKDLRRAIDLAKTDWRDVLIAAGFGSDVKAHDSWWPGPTVPQKKTP